ncbi:MAG: coenzyme F430 synthase [Halobacteriota archaeon]
MDFNGKSVAVLDTIHGGRQICKKLREIGADAVAIDIYRDSPAPDAIDAFDAVMAPVHAHTVLTARAEASGIPVLTHHQAVGHLARQSKILQDALVFEVTGVKGKTTTASLLGVAFSDRKLLTLTSRGLEIRENGKYVAKKQLSITPANILTALDLVREFDFDPEVCIFEVSLGGTGLADVNILTTLSPEYRIAQETKTSTFAKLQMLSNAKASSCLVMSTATESLAEPGRCLNTFGDEGATVRYENVEPEEVTIAYSDLARIDGRCVSGEVRFTPTGCYDLASYEDALLCFVTAALSSTLDPEVIAHKLAHFKGVMGRMSAAVIKKRLLVDNSNSGLEVTSIKRAIRYGLTLKKSGHKAVLIIGVEAKNVCDGIAPEALAPLAEDAAFDDVVVIGDQMRTSRANVVRSNDLESALRATLTLTKERDVIISCVKMWR